MPTTTGMKAGGFYDANSSTQWLALDDFLPWLEDSASTMSLPADSRPIALLDPGCSEGANAIHAMGRLVRVLRRRSEAPIWVFFEDLLTNDFNRLFTNLFDGAALAFPEPGVFAAAVGGSEFGQVVPAGCLQVATTFNGHQPMGVCQPIRDRNSESLP